jgi:hypothetical protein
MASTVTAVPIITTTIGSAAASLFGQHAVARADHRHEAVGAQARGMVVAVDDAGLARARHHPARGAVEALVDLLLGAPAQGVAGHHAAQHGRGRGQVGPGAVGQPLDVVQKFRPLRLQRGARMRPVVERPFEAGVADVDREEGGCHARDYCDFVKTPAGGAVAWAAHTRHGPTPARRVPPHHSQIAPPRHKERTMGLLSFIKEAGEKLFGGSSAHAATPAPDARTPTPPRQPPSRPTSRRRTSASPGWS